MISKVARLSVPRTQRNQPIGVADARATSSRARPNQDAAEYSQLVEAVEQAEFVAGIKRGLDSMERGEGVPLEVAVRRLRKRHKISKAA